MRGLTTRRFKLNRRMRDMKTIAQVQLIPVKMSPHSDIGISAIVT